MNPEEEPGQRQGLQRPLGCRGRRVRNPSRPGSGCSQREAGYMPATDLSPHEKHAPLQTGGGSGCGELPPSSGSWFTNIRLNDPSVQFPAFKGQGTASCPVPAYRTGWADGLSSMASPATKAENTRRAASNRTDRRRARMADVHRLLNSSTYSLAGVTSASATPSRRRRGRRAPADEAWSPRSRSSFVSPRGYFPGVQALQVAERRSIEPMGRVDPHSSATDTTTTAMRWPSPDSQLINAKENDRLRDVEG